MKVKVVTLLVLSFAIVVSCKEEPPTPREHATEILVSATKWSKPVVIVDGVDVSETYKDFSISFENTTYSTSGGAPMWAPAGKWMFTDEDAKHILLDDTVDIDITLTDTELRLDRLWEFETFEPGRTKSVKGKHQFTMVPGGWR
jgi:hypothetical protein